MGGGVDSTVRVLLLSTTTGYQLRSFEESAERLGIELMLATDRCHHLDDPWRDGAVAVRFHDEEASLAAIVDAARQRPLSGIIAVGDRPTILAARAAEALSLHGNPPHAADASRNKKLMRQRFAAAGLEVPWFVEVSAGADVEAVAPLVRYPAVVKPLGLSGSRGVIRADSAEQLGRAIQRVRALLARPAVRALRSGLEDTLLIEGYIDGREYAVEGLLTGGELRILAAFDKPDPLEGPFFEETIYVTPPAAPSDVQRAIAVTVQRATAALGLVHGPVHAECRVGERGVVMLEVAARPIGGLCSKVLRFCDRGVLAPLEDLLLKHACGADVSTYARDGSAAGVMMSPIATRGVFKGVAGEDRARQVRHIDDIRITAKTDQLLEPLPEGDSYLGFIFARAETSEQVVVALREAHRQLMFHIAPEITVRAGTVTDVRE
jgi:biotin carboxylase